MPFSRSDDNGITGSKILRTVTLCLNTHTALDHEEPLWAGVAVPVRSRTVRECNAIHANWNAGLVMGQALHRRAPDEGCRIDRTDRRAT